MITNKYIWINRNLLALGLHDRKLGLLCRLAELMIEDGSLMEQDEKDYANKKYICNFLKVQQKFDDIMADLIEHKILICENEKYRFNEKYVILPNTKQKSVRTFVRVSCSNFDRLFGEHFHGNMFTGIGHLVRLALNIGVLDNSVRENVYCVDSSKYVSLGLDEVFTEYSETQIKRIKSDLKNMTFKGKPCVEFQQTKIIVNPLLFNTSGIILRKRDETKPFISEGEEMTKMFLNKYHFEYETQKRFDGLVGVNGGELSYDFYLPELNILIECQGSQHFAISTYVGEEGFFKQREHDHRKWEYAKNHNITLIELPYWHYKNAEEYLKKFFRKTLDKTTN